MKTKLLASAPTQTRILKYIDDFYCSRGSSLISTGNPKIFDVMTGSGKLMTDVQVRKFKNRYRFEAINSEKEVCGYV